MIFTLCKGYILSIAIPFELKCPLFILKLWYNRCNIWLFGGFFMNKNEVIDMLLKAYEDLKIEFNSTNYQKWCKNNPKECVPYHKVRSMFGNWNEAIEESGILFLKNLELRKEIVNTLKESYNELNNDLNEDTYNQWSKENEKISLYIIKEEFGSWDKALRMAGIRSKLNLKKDTKQDMVNGLLKASEELGYKFNKTNYNVWAKKNGAKSVLLISKKFGGWNKALLAAGVGLKKKQEKESNQRKENNINQEGKLPTRKECDIVLWEAFSDLGDELTSSSYKKWAFENKHIPLHIIENQFESWENALIKTKIDQAIEHKRFEKKIKSKKR